MHHVKICLPYDKNSKSNNNFYPKWEHVDPLLSIFNINSQLHQVTNVYLQSHVWISANPFEYTLTIKGSPWRTAFHSKIVLWLCRHYPRQSRLFLVVIPMLEQAANATRAWCIHLYGTVAEMLFLTCFVTSFVLLSIREIASLQQSKHISPLALASVFIYIILCICHFAHSAWNAVCNFPVFLYHSVLTVLCF